MAAEPLIQTLNKILLLHKSFNKIAKQKTEVIKAGDTDALNALIKEERKHIQAIQKFENERQKLSKDYLSTFDCEVANPTISDCMQFANVTEKQKLSQIKEDLQTQVKFLSERNELNQQLLQQSLQFVNMSLDILRPDIDTYNYGRPGKAHQYEEGRSIFNSKA
ncbi:flagellar protein FlgN [Bacillus sp. Marseille-P3661]|uniref:flagellar protein FlgN n=1 Tax=Bacillus sp. Marseille-P3661 TaxID=1936234 RepID=UPI000C84A112|nr:flagellar protein FlgN [Bacillus sp. Marseille-P3661]